MDFLDELRETEAIKQLKYRYMRAIDEKLWKQMEECFVEEATCSYSSGKYAFEGRDAIMRFLTESIPRSSCSSRPHAARWSRKNGHRAEALLPDRSRSESSPRIRTRFEACFGGSDSTC